MSNAKLTGFDSCLGSLLPETKRVIYMQKMRSVGESVKDFVEHIVDFLGSLVRFF